MNLKEPVTKLCQVCGREFHDYTSKAKYCPECKTAAYREKHKDYLRAQKQASKVPKPPKRSLDGKLEELKASGISYAEHQRAESIRMFAAVKGEA